MQIFRPYVDWRKSAAVLDDLRLGKQRVEAKQVLNAFFRKLGYIRDGLKGWLSHPIVILYYNNGKPYIDDVVGFFYACVDEWKRRGKQSNVNLDDIQQYIEKTEKTPGTPVNRIHEIEYRRILLVKDPKHYVKVFPYEEIVEVLETEPVKVSGINSWLFDNPAVYRNFVKKIKKML
ncbi:MAG: pyrimidine dimer DNA glycosylase/endonuclease V [Candidatus Caldarchaeum sp.]|uniref:Pyrimidine dimer DNA glycosylase n=1 Tax=Caldiarchaeum subterraneum TaxID=311458 RepID=A0A7C5UAC5_CALS0